MVGTSNSSSCLIASISTWQSKYSGTDFSCFEPSFGFSLSSSTSLQGDEGGTCLGEVLADSVKITIPPFASQKVCHTFGKGGNEGG